MSVNSPSSLSDLTVALDEMGVTSTLNSHDSNALTLTLTSRSKRELRKAIALVTSSITGSAVIRITGHSAKIQL